MAGSASDHRQGIDEAEASRRDAGLVGGSFHFNSDEIVGEHDPPELLANSLGCAAANRFLALEHVGLDLVVAQLDLPAFVIESHDLGRGIVGWVDERGQQRYGIEATSLVGNCARVPHRR